MDHVPVGSVLLLFVTDLMIIESLSLFLGLVVASAGGASTWKGALLGLLVPVVGPLVWAVVLVGRRPPLMSASRLRSRGFGVYGAAALLAFAAVLLLTAAVMPWGEVVGEYDDYLLAGDAAPVDSALGFLLTVGSALLLAVEAVVALIFAAWGRLALLTAVLGAGWLLVTVDGLIVFSALSELSETVEGLSGGSARAQIGARGGLWLALVASVFALTATVVLAVLPRARWAPISPGVAATGLETPRSPAGARTTTGFPQSSNTPQSGYDYGDGF